MLLFSGCGDGSAAVAMAVVHNMKCAQVSEVKPIKLLKWLSIYGFFAFLWNTFNLINEANSLTIDNDDERRFYY